MSAVVESRDRLLAGIAALREADVGAVEARLGREDAVVELSAPARRAGGDPQPLQLVLAHELSVGGRAEHLDCPLAVLVRRNPAFGRPEDDEGLVLDLLDLALRGEAHPRELARDDLAQLRLGQQEEVVLLAPGNPHGRDQPRLRRQQQRVTGAADRNRRDAVREHALQVVLRLGAGHAHVRARAGGDS